jgi:intracellular septation protein
MASYPPMKLVSFFLEILPLAGFFLGYEFFGLFAAAVISVGLGALVMGANWLQTRRLARFALFSLLMSGGMTLAALYFNAAIFIKIQPTIFNGLFAIVLLGGLFFRRAMMREFFGTQFHLTAPTWFLLSRRWGLFFLCFAIANELVWRNASDADWVAFKTFIAAPCQRFIYDGAIAADASWANCQHYARWRSIGNWLAIIGKESTAIFGR